MESKVGGLDSTCKVHSDSCAAQLSSKQTSQTRLAVGYGSQGPWPRFDMRSALWQLRSAQMSSKQTSQTRSADPDGRFGVDFLLHLASQGWSLWAPLSRPKPIKKSNGNRTSQKVALRSPQDRHKDRSKAAQDHPKTAQDGPRTTPRHPKA